MEDAYVVTDDYAANIVSIDVGGIRKLYAYISANIPINMAPKSTPPIRIMLALARANSFPHTKFSCDKMKNSPLEGK